MLSALWQIAGRSSALSLCSARVFSHVLLKRLYDNPVDNRHAIGWEVLPELHALILQHAEKLVQVHHCPARNIVQDNQAPLVRSGVLKCAIDPCAGIAPISGNAVPQHAREFSGLKYLDRRRIQQVLSNLPGPARVCC